MSEDEKAIRSLIAEWHQATAAGDVERVLALIDEDVVFLGAGRAPMRGRAAFAAAQRAVLRSHRIEPGGDVREIRTSGDLAWCWTELSVRITPRAGGMSTTRTGPVLTILQKTAGAWRVVRDANMLA